VGCAEEEGTWQHMIELRKPGIVGDSVYDIGARGVSRVVSDELHAESLNRLPAILDHHKKTGTSANSGVHKSASSGQNWKNRRYEQGQERRRYRVLILHFYNPAS
jgi:hypothetical protein